MYLIQDLDLIRIGYDRQVRLNRVVCILGASAGAGGPDDPGVDIDVYLSAVDVHCRSRKEVSFLGPM